MQYIKKVKRVKQHYLISIFLLCFLYAFGAEVTYELSGGRFGDNLVSYLHAKWISYQYNISLAYQPFQYSDQLVLHLFEKRGSYPRLKRITLTKNNLTIDRNKQWLYVVPYFAEVLSEHKHPANRNWIYFPVNWNDQRFRQQIKEMIKPRDPEILRFDLPEDKITVALHVRKGGGFDKPLLSDAEVIQHPYSYYADYHSMLKFPPEKFFVEQLRRVSEHFHNAPLYVYVFTDDTNPTALVQRLKNQLGNYPNIEFDYRKENNRHDANVLKDFFALITFDCLIRPQSNFSLVAAKLADYKLEIYPTECHWVGAVPYIDKVETIIK